MANLTNPVSVSAQYNIGKSGVALKKAGDQLSSGVRGPSGGITDYVVGSSLRNSAEVLSGVRNSLTYGGKMCGVAQNALVSIQGSLTDIANLVAQAGTAQGTTLAQLNALYQQKMAAIDRIIKTTEFDERLLFNGSLADSKNVPVTANMPANSAVLDIRAGEDLTNTIALSIPRLMAGDGTTKDAAVAGKFTPVFGSRFDANVNTALNAITSYIVGANSATSLLALKLAAPVTTGTAQDVINKAAIDAATITNNDIVTYSTATTNALNVAQTVVTFKGQIDAQVNQAQLLFDYDANVNAATKRAADAATYTTALVNAVNALAVGAVDTPAGFSTAVQAMPPVAIPANMNNHDQQLILNTLYAGVNAAIIAPAANFAASKLLAVNLVMNLNLATDATVASAGAAGGIAVAQVDADAATDMTSAAVVLNTILTAAQVPAVGGSQVGTAANIAAAYTAVTAAVLVKNIAAGGGLVVPANQVATTADATALNTAKNAAVTAAAVATLILAQTTGIATNYTSIAGANITSLPAGNLPKAGFTNNKAGYNAIINPVVTAAGDQTLIKNALTAAAAATVDTFTNGVTSANTALNTVAISALNQGFANTLTNDAAGVVAVLNSVQIPTTSTVYVSALLAAMSSAATTAAANFATTAAAGNATAAANAAVGAQQVKESALEAAKTSANGVSSAYSNLLTDDNRKISTKIVTDATATVTGTISMIGGLMDVVDQANNDVGSFITVLSDTADEYLSTNYEEAASEFKSFLLSMQGALAQLSQGFQVPQAVLQLINA